MHIQMIWMKKKHITNTCTRPAQIAVQNQRRARMN